MKNNKLKITWKFTDGSSKEEQGGHLEKAFDILFREVENNTKMVKPKKDLTI